MGPQRGALVGEVVVTVAPGCGMDKLRGQHRSARWRWRIAPPLNTKLR